MRQCSDDQNKLQNVLWKVFNSIEGSEKIVAETSNLEYVTTQAKKNDRLRLERSQLKRKYGEWKMKWESVKYEISMLRNSYAYKISEMVTAPVFYLKKVIRGWSWRSVDQLVFRYYFFSYFSCTILDHHITFLDILHKGYD